VEQVGPYQVIEEIARGGQGVVLKAQHVSRGTTVALKLLLSGDADSYARFEREAETLARLSHPNLLGVDGYGQLPDGTPYLAMEFVRGKDLLDLVRTHGRLGPEDLAEILLPLAEALHYCHEQGVVHRDVKPQNVMFEEGTGRVLLVDFGLIKRDRLREAWAVQDRQSLTQEGTMLGTPAFMPPEQVSEEFGQVDARSDVYALGGLLYFLLTGHKPYAGESTVNVIVKVMGSPPPDPRGLVSSVPPALAELCLRSMAKDMDERPASAAVFAEALRVHILSAPKEGSGSRLLAALVCLGVLGLALGGVYAATWEPAEPSLAIASPSSPTPGASARASASASRRSSSPSPSPSPSSAKSPEHVEALYQRALAHEAGEGVPRDMKRAREAYLQAALGGHLGAAFRLGSLLDRDGGPNSLAAAARWFRRAAEGGNTQAMNRLGRAYQDGRGVPHDRAQALAWHRRAAETGDVKGMYSLGLLFSSGARSPSEFAQAREWAGRAARLGHMDAQFLLGRMLSTGKGGAKDGALAYEWHQRAFKQGKAESCYYLGVICAKGNGVPEDQERAAEWFRRGAEAGHGQSMYFLALRCFDGKGVPKDRAKGLEWLQRATTASGSARWRDAARSELKRRQ